MEVRERSGRTRLFLYVTKMSAHRRDRQRERSPQDKRSKRKKLRNENPAATQVVPESDVIKLKIDKSLLRELRLSNSSEFPPSLSYYAESSNREKLLDEVFSILSETEIRDMLPDILKGLKLRNIKSYCKKYLLQMDKAFLLGVIKGECEDFSRDKEMELSDVSDIEEEESGGTIGIPSKETNNPIVMKSDIEWKLQTVPDIQSSNSSKSMTDCNSAITELVHSSTVNASITTSKQDILRKNQIEAEQMDLNTCVTSSLSTVEGGSKSNEVNDESDDVLILATSITDDIDIELAGSPLNKRKSDSSSKRRTKSCLEKSKVYKSPGRGKEKTEMELRQKLLKKVATKTGTLQTLHKDDTVGVGNSEGFELEMKEKALKSLLLKLSQNSNAKQSY